MLGILRGGGKSCAGTLAAIGQRRRSPNGWAGRAASAFAALDSCTLGRNNAHHQPLGSRLKALAQRERLELLLPDQSGHSVVADTDVGSRRKRNWASNAQRDHARLW